MAERYLCEPCGIFFRDGKQYKIHIQSGHQNTFLASKIDKQKQQEKDFVCNICDKKFTRNDHLQYHMAHHVNARDHVCSLCPKAYNTASDLSQHFKSHDQGIAQKCKDCGSFFDEKRELDLHMRTDHNQDNKTKWKSYHKKEEPKECNLCGSIVKNIRVHHFTVHLNIREHECDICHKKFNKNFGLKRHKETVHDKLRNYVCDICGFAFADKGKMKKHRNNHDSENKYDLTVQLDKKWECDVCGKAFGKQSLLNRHSLSHDANRKRLYCTVCKTFIENIKDHYDSFHMDLRFSCKHCHRRFRKDRECQSHVISKHTDIKKWLCDFCGKEFSLKNSLRRHVEGHEGVFACETCGLVFNTVASLRLHAVVHQTKEEPKNPNNECYICHRRFIRSYGLKRHIRTVHEKEKVANPVTADRTIVNKRRNSQDSFNSPHFCPICKEGIEDIKEHYGTLHMDRPFCCKFCFRRFRRRRELDIHEANKHTHKKEHLCHSCGKGFGDQSSLNRHRLLHDSTQKFPYCTICKKYIDQVKEHYEGFHMDLEYSCKFCHRRFRRERECKNHLDSRHSAKRKWLCGFCGKEFALKYSLKRHTEKHEQAEGSYECDLCGLVFYNKDAIRNHIMAHKRWRNAENLDDEKSESDESDHFEPIYKPAADDHENFVNFVNIKKEPEEAVVTVEVMVNQSPSKDEKSFWDSDFATKQEESDHDDGDDDDYFEQFFNDKKAAPQQSKSSKNANEDPISASGSTKSTNAFVCALCKETFANQAELFKHHNAQHISGIMINCDECTRKFSTRNELRLHKEFQHSKQHKIEKKIQPKNDCKSFDCDHCGDRLLTKLELKTHMLNHIKSIHHCDICGKGFKFITTLDAHRKIHGGGEFACTYCGRKFVKNTDLLSHIRTHTNEKPFKCHICDQRFSLKQLLQFHLKTHPKKSK